MTRTLFAAIFVAAFCAQAQGNVANFNALMAGTSYAAPALFSDGGLDFDVLSGLRNVNVLAVNGQVNPSFNGNYLELKSSDLLNVNLPTGASQIQLDFIQNSSAALVVNGGWLDLSQIPTTVNGVTVVHLLPTKSNWGSITASGTINSFLVVGTDLLIDNMNVTQLAGLPGDYNKNHIVDAGDYAVWRKTLNTPSGFRSWRKSFGATGSAGTSAFASGVPEPSALALLLAGMQCFAIQRRRKEMRSARQQRETCC
jgi:hypothetical protein